MAISAEHRINNLQPFTGYDDASINHELDDNPKQTNKKKNKWMKKKNQAI